MKQKKQNLLKRAAMVAKKRSVKVAIAVAFLLVFAIWCGSRTPAQKAERAFIKMFERDYPKWKISKIVLSPCRGKNKYRGCFDCTAKSDTSKCCVRYYNCGIADLGYWGECTEVHNRGETLTWSVLVTFAHGDCYYKLGGSASEYE